MRREGPRTAAPALEKLLHSSDVDARRAAAVALTRIGAAFSLGQIGELAVVALPDLEKAARDPRNRDFADHMESVIERLRR